MLRTLVLLRIRCGCFDTDVEVGAGMEDSVWTFEKHFQDRNLDSADCMKIILSLLVPESWAGLGSCSPEETFVSM